MAGHITIKDMHEIASLNKGRCLSKEYLDENSLLKWQCENGHTWDADYVAIRQGSWCKQCLRKHYQKLTIREIKAIARSRGGKCLSEEYINSVTPLQFQCKKGHIWKGRPTMIKFGTWCPFCAGNVRKTIQDMQVLAKEKGIVCLSKNYVNIDTKLRWKCPKGHIWKATPFGIKKNRASCPLCAGYLNKSNLGIHSSTKYTIKKLNDQAKLNNGKCLSTLYKRKSKLTWQCSEGHLWKATAASVMSGRWCYKCRIKQRGERQKLKLEDVHKIAKAKGGKYLGSSYVNALTLTEWQCGNGHKWMATTASIKWGTWCPYCAHNVKHTIESMRKLAGLRGGECLSRKYLNNKSDLMWRCRKGHEWMAIPNNVIRGSWCRKCSREATEIKKHQIKGVTI